MSASCTSGRLRSVQVSNRAPDNAAAPAAICAPQPSMGKSKLLAMMTPSAGDLRDGEIDEHDAAREHLLPQRHMRDCHQAARDQRGHQDAEIELPKCSFGCRQQSLDGVVEQAEQILCLGLPPTENGSTTAGACTRSESQLAAFGSL